MPCSKPHEMNLMAPKPVRPRAIKYHGLFGISTARQHLIVDEKWTPTSLTEQYDIFTQLLSRRISYKRHEAISNRRLLKNKFKELKLQCNDGHIKLHKIQSGNNAHKIRNSLINHRYMQRLYQRMPMYMVVDNINQRTFVLRKERDGLGFLLDQRKDEYKKLLVERSNVENLIRYSKEFIVEEEKQSRLLSKKIQNSNVRLNAIRTINTTYKKMVQALLQDEIFYEPILSSLDSDMEEQAQFIKNILYLGMPVISKFKQLNYEFLQLEKKSRENLNDKINMLNTLLRPKAINTEKITQNVQKGRKRTSASPGKYVRYTHSMSLLKEQLSTVDNTIKELKMIACCSQAREIYPRMKNNNINLHAHIEKNLLYHDMLRTKMGCSSTYEKILVNNLSEEEINRITYIEELQKILKLDTTFEEQTLEHIKKRADVYVMFRFSLWNLAEVMRHIGQSCKVFKTEYPNSYLRLPFLKFEMLQLRGIPPTLHEENVNKLMSIIKRKLQILMKAYRSEMASNCREKYHRNLLDSKILITIGHEDEKALGDEYFSNKQTNVPGRKQIKAQSARILEAVAKRDE